MQALICDDHPFVARALSMTIDAAFGTSSFVAHSFADAIAHAQDTPGLGLCLVDFHIPGEDSVDGLQRLRAASPESRFLVFSGSESDDDLRLALELGVDGFLPKSSPPEVVEAAVRLVLAGGRYLPERVGSLAFGGAAQPVSPGPMSTGPGPVEARAGARPFPLTERQRDVLGHMADGLANKEIARALGISPATVKVHVAQIIGIVGARNRTEAVARARQDGLL
ncbi:MAG: response regulator transcription factor [Sphingomonadaceae bacterium]|nr:response regulator transcription factor [Sphingomonadaceae bacterium]